MDGGTSSAERVAPWPEMSEATEGTAVPFNMDYDVGAEAKMQQMQVAVPNGILPGEAFQVETPTGPMQLECPEHVGPGGSMDFMMPLAPTSHGVTTTICTAEETVQVPSGVEQQELKAATIVASGVALWRACGDPGVTLYEVSSGLTMLPVGSPDLDPLAAVELMRYALSSPTPQSSPGRPRTSHKPTAEIHVATTSSPAAANLPTAEIHVATSSSRAWEELPPLTSPLGFLCEYRTSSFPLSSQRISLGVRSDACRVAKASADAVLRAWREALLHVRVQCISSTPGRTLCAYVHILDPGATDHDRLRLTLTSINHDLDRA